MAELKNEKHEAFANRYIIDLNGTKSYMYVYPASSYDAARSSAAELLAKPNVDARIDELKAIRAKQCKLDQEAILNELQTALSTDITDFIDLTPQEVKQLPLEIRRQITGFKKHDKTYTDEGGNQVTETRFELQFIDRKAVIDMLNKHTGFYEKHNKQQNAPIVVVTGEEAKKISDALEASV